MLQKKAKTDRAETIRARRQLIVETAIECFIDKGFHQTSVRDIAKRAGISLGNLYNHFENKNALIAEIAAAEAQELDEFTTELAQISDTSKALDHFIDLYLDESLKPETAILTAEIMSEGLRNPDIVTDFMVNHAGLTQFLAELIQSSAGKLTNLGALPAHTRAEFIIDLIEGFSVRFALEQKKPSAKDIKGLHSAIRRLVDW